MPDRTFQQSSVLPVTCRLERTRMLVYLKPRRRGCVITKKQNGTGGQKSLAAPFALPPTTFAVTSSLGSGRRLYPRPQKNVLRIARGEPLTEQAPPPKPKRLRELLQTALLIRTPPTRKPH